jgi:hypothetical protein
MIKRNNCKDQEQHRYSAAAELYSAAINTKLN